jgi:hypothetical protein
MGNPSDRTGDLMSQRQEPSRGDFRLVDLLVLLSIGIVLILLALPVVYRTDRDYGRVYCQNNLKLLALAIHNYASTWNNALPALSGAPIEGGVARPQSIFFTLLPYLEEEKIHDAATKQAVTRTWEAAVPGSSDPVFRTIVLLFHCPADSSNSTTFPAAAGWGGSSYAANAQVFGINPGVVNEPAPGGKSWNVLQPQYDIRTIPDGTSNTIFLTERFALAGRGNAATPCAWANPPAGGASIGGNFDALGCPLQRFVGNGVVRASVCGPAVFFGSGVPGDPVGAIAGDGSVPMYPLPEIHVVPEDASTDGQAQSQHRHVVQIAMGDGSARGISATVSQVTWVRAICPDDRKDLGKDW